MHMADALISPLVGGTMMAATAGLATYSVKRIQTELDDRKVPLMGVMGAFVFATQMINFSIPGTGSSGHLGGGMLLAILLGPHAGFLTMAAILLIQALFFGDGGLLAYGCNVFNLGFFTCFLAYPLIYRWITRNGFSARRIFTASMLSSVIGLQLGSLGVVIETLFSGRTELPAGSFLLLMQSIHLAIGVVEGLVTAAVVSFVWKARPEIIAPLPAAQPQPAGKASLRTVLAILLAAVVLIGGALSLFASADPDGLEWSLEKAASPAASETAEPELQGIHKALAWLQEKTALLPDYSFRENEAAAEHPVPANPAAEETPGGLTDLAGMAGTSVSGLVGGAITLLLVAGIGWLATRMKRRHGKAAA